MFDSLKKFLHIRWLVSRNSKLCCRAPTSQSMSSLDSVACAADRTYASTSWLWKNDRLKNVHLIYRENLFMARKCRALIICITGAELKMVTIAWRIRCPAVNKRGEEPIFICKLQKWKKRLAWVRQSSMKGVSRHRPRSLLPWKTPGKGWVRAVWHRIMSGPACYIGTNFKLGRGKIM